MLSNQAEKNKKYLTNSAPNVQIADFNKKKSIWKGGSVPSKVPQKIGEDSPLAYIPGLGSSTQLMSKKNAMESQERDSTSKFGSYNAKR